MSRSASAVIAALCMLSCAGALVSCGSSDGTSTATTVDPAVAATGAAVPPYEGAASGRAVVVIGDSITEQARGALHEALDPTLRTSVLGITGAESKDMVGVAGRMSALNPEVVVVNLGTNDVQHAVPVDASMASLGAIVAAFPTARCVAVATIAEPALAAKFAARAKELNARIRALPGKNPVVRLFDYEKQREAYEKEGEPDGKLASPDLVHLTDEGNAVYARWVRDAIAGCPPCRACSSRTPTQAPAHLDPDPDPGEPFGVVRLDRARV